jgi:4-amino-4-deoxy-L-arabinose transferase-like glycosyltransferase
VAWLLAATGLGVGIGLALGACGELRLAPALALALLACGGLAAGRGGRSALAALTRPARHLGNRIVAHLRRHWVLALLACHAIGSEALRGLVRPPLSWDSLMYHLTLAATWLQRHDLAPVFGAYPMNYYGYTPANGAVWLWWWMAPSHSELYANLAFLPQWALLALATGAVARRLGARRAWPLAAFLVAMTPTVLRFAATQYVDIFTAACLLGACCHGLSWLREPRWGEAALAGIGLGLAAGAKVLGLVYAAALAAALLPLAVGRWRRRAAQAAAALAVAAALGGFFYLRNAARGVDPLALECEGLPHRRPAHGLPVLPRPGSVAAMPHQMLAEGRLARALFGTTSAPPFVDLGLGPQTLVVLLGIPALAALPRERRREAAVAGSQLLAEVAFWLTVPFAATGHVFANVRYLLPAVGLAFAGGVAAAESLGADERLLRFLAVALAAQDLLQLHTEMPDGVRLVVATADVAVLALALLPRLRGWLGAPEGSGGGRRRRALAGAALVAMLAGVPGLARFRAADRTRALAQEYTAHGNNVALYAAGWDWLERYGGSGTVAVVNSPDTFFFYPAMGLRLERRAVYVNVNAANLDEAAAYPLCQPRVEPAAAAWIANLRTAGVRWLDLTRTPPYPFPIESDWARAHPELFVQRFADPTNVIYELLPAAPPRQGPRAPAGRGPGA